MFSDLVLRVPSKILIFPSALFYRLTLRSESMKSVVTGSQGRRTWTRISFGTKGFMFFDRPSGALDNLRTIAIALRRRNLLYNLVKSLTLFD